jgi:hypothetical protein
VETEFVRPVLLGEKVLPYHVLPAREAVLPLEGNDSSRNTKRGSRLR